MGTPSVLVRLDMGDTSGDGHGATATVVIQVGGPGVLGAEDAVRLLTEAYTKGVEIVGFDVKNRMQAFEGRTLSLKEWSRLGELNLTAMTGWSLPIDEEEAADLWVFGDEYFDLWLFFCRIGNPSLQIGGVDLPCLDVGGYGCF